MRRAREIRIRFIFMVPITITIPRGELQMRTIIKNGRIVTAVDDYNADILIEDGQVALIAKPGAKTISADADKVVDARGRLLIPGGIDAHTHMELPFGGTSASDTFETGTRAAAWGGVTTIVDFAVQRTGEVVQDGLAAWHAKAQGNCVIDYGFHMILGGVDDDALKAMDQP